MKCIFCDISKRKQTAHIIWEDEKHLAFLSIYPNTPGASVVITKEHHSSYAFDQSDNTLSDLIIAAKQTAVLLDNSLPDVARTGMILEGYGVDHLHAKLFPMHQTGNSSKFKKINSNIATFFTRYEGYISSHDGKREDDSTLEKQASMIRAYNFKI
ncbi:HIT family protein [Pseudomonas sp. R3-56]|uniref:HIT family protein n=1 Tax=Pseudomonas sp. R3-56 TaxID=2817401 RepID=UPI003DA9D4F4